MLKLSYEWWHWDFHSWQKTLFISTDFTAELCKPCHQVSLCWKQRLPSAILMQELSPRQRVVREEKLLQHNHILQQSLKPRFQGGRGKTNPKTHSAFQVFFGRCDRTRKQIKEPRETSQYLLLNILKTTGSEGRIQLPAAGHWVFLPFIPGAAFGKHLAEAITTHCADSVTIDTYMMRIPAIQDLSHLGLLWMTQYLYILVFHFSCVFPSHTNMTLCDKATTSAVGQYTDTQSFSASYHHAGTPALWTCVEMTQLFWQTGRGTKSIHAHC